MAAALDTLPAMVVTATSDDPDGPTPLPVTVDISNDHLQYAITWFALAMVGLDAFFFRQRLNRLLQRIRHVLA